jgi:hypothetical protein
MKYLIEGSEDLRLDIKMVSAFCIAVLRVSLDLTLHDINRFASITFGCGKPNYDCLCEF